MHKGTNSRVIIGGPKKTNGGTVHITRCRALRCAQFYFPMSHSFQTGSPPHSATTSRTSDFMEQRQRRRRVGGRRRCTSSRTSKGYEGYLALSLSCVDMRETPRTVHIYVTCKCESLRKLKTINLYGVTRLTSRSLTSIGELPELTFLAVEITDRFPLDVWTDFMQGLSSRIHVEVEEDFGQATYFPMRL